MNQPHLRFEITSDDGFSVQASSIEGKRLFHILPRAEQSNARKSLFGIQPAVVAALLSQSPGVR